MNLYKNDQLVGTSEEASGTLAQDALTNIRIGANPVGSRWFDGVIGEVVVFRRALTAAEISNYYEGSRP